MKKLYSRTATGAVQVWWAEQDGDKYTQSYGQQHGAIVTTDPTVCLPKNVGRANETSGEAQAAKEVKALYTKKLKTGYFENIEDIDKLQYVEPMLAKKFDDRKAKVVYPVIVQNKYNGARCVATKDGLFSRKGEKFLSCPHIEEDLAPFFKHNPDAVLDGELLGVGCKEKLNETMSLIRRTANITPEHLAKTREMILYHTYDCYGFKGIEKSSTYPVRQAALDIAMFDTLYIRPVPSVLCCNEEEVMEHFQTLIDDNEEGAIVRVIDAPYENKRSSYLLKLKPEDDDEAIIRDITEGTGNWAGTGKRITLEWKGLTFDATFKGTYEEAVIFLYNKEFWIGRTVTFLYNGLTGLGVPNYARVDINNCLKG